MTAIAVSERAGYSIPGIIGSVVDPRISGVHCLPNRYAVHSRRQSSAKKCRYRRRVRSRPVVSRGTMIGVSAQTTDGLEDRSASASGVALAGVAAGVVGFALVVVMPPVAAGLALALDAVLVVRLLERAAPRRLAAAATVLSAIALAYFSLAVYQS